MDKNEELQKWLNDDRYVEKKELLKLWHISETGFYNTLREKKIKPAKKINMGRIGCYVFFNKKECEDARPFKSNKKELQDWINSDVYVQTKELASIWGISMHSASRFLRTKNIYPVKRFSFGMTGGKYCFYNRAECISARSSLYENEELIKLINDNSCVQTHKLSEIWNMAHTTVSACLRSANIKPKKIINLGGGGGRFVFYDKKECESSILNQKNIRDDLYLWLNDDKYVRPTTLSELWGCTAGSVATLLRKYRIQPTKTIRAGRDGVFSFYDKARCMSAKDDASNRKNELKYWLDNKNYIRPEELKNILGLNSSGVTYFLRKRNIKPVKKIFTGNRGGSFVFYDRAECERARPFINQPEQKEVEQVEEKQMELPEPKEQTPDIIPADTIDLFTMSELELELKNRGVELTAEVRNKINASDMPEMKHIATMLRGNAKTITIRLSVLNEIAGQLRGVVENNDTDQDFEREKKEEPNAAMLIDRLDAKLCQIDSAMNQLRVESAEIRRLVAEIKLAISPQLC